MSCLLDGKHSPSEGLLYANKEGFFYNNWTPLFAFQSWQEEKAPIVANTYQALCGVHSMDFEDEWWREPFAMYVFVYEKLFSENFQHADVVLGARDTTANERLTVYKYQFIPQILIDYLAYTKCSANFWRYQSEQISDIITFTN